MTVFVHSIVIISFKFLFVDRLGPTATLKQNVFETDSCLLALTISTSHMQSCFKIDLGFIKLYNV